MDEKNCSTVPVGDFEEIYELLLTQTTPVVCVDGLRDELCGIVAEAIATAGENVCPQATGDCTGCRGRLCARRFHETVVSALKEFCQEYPGNGWGINIFAPSIIDWGKALYSHPVFLSKLQEVHDTWTAQTL